MTTLRHLAWNRDWFGLAIISIGGTVYAALLALSVYIVAHGGL